jgi:hypothetical protein
MYIRRIIAGAAVTVMALTTLVGTADAEPASKRTFARVIGTVHIDPDDPSVAYVRALYRCTVADPVNDPAQLWVSVKQNDEGTRDPEVAGEGSGFGGVATRWEDSHRNGVDCDGRLHADTFTVDQIEGKDAYGTLTRGQGWVQFCLFDDTTPKGDGETDFGEPVSHMVWRFVH